MRLTPFMLALLALPMAVAGTPAGAQSAEDQPTYKQFGSLGGFGDGFKQKQLKDGWQVTAIVRASKPPASAAAMALYRAAELAESSSFKNVRIVSFKEKALENYAAGMMFTSGYTAKIVFTATNDSDPTSHCTAKVSASCVTYDAAAAMAELGPSLKFDKGN